MKKIILVVILCFSLLVIPVNSVQVQAASGSPQGTTEFTYRSTKKTEIDRGGTTVKTGDNAELGNWLMLASGSGILLFLLIGLRKRKSEEENGEI